MVLWDIASATKSAWTTGHVGMIQQIEVSPNSRRVATAGSNGAVGIWDLDSILEPTRRFTPF
jgi:WD40 repeat protein